MILISTLSAVALIVLGWSAWATFYADWLWFQNLGYQTVFSTILVTKIMLGVTTALIVTAFIWVNLRLALRLSSELPYAERFFEINGQRVQAPDLGRLVSRLVLPAALIVGVFMGFGAWQDWELFLRYRHQVPFGEVDPIFGRDISFYFFTLPALDAALRVLLTLSTITLIGAAGLYAARGSITFDNQRLRLTEERGPRSHLLILVAAVSLVLAWQAYLEIPNLVLSPAGPAAGASYTDIHATLPFLYVRLAVAVLVAVFAAISLFQRKSRLLRIGIGAYVLVLLGGWLYPSAVQRLSVAPNELSMETPYIEYNIAATRKAFALDKIEERELSGDTALAASDIQANRRTINNIRLWDRQPLLDTFAQIQEIRTYYEFQSVDNDRYKIDGEMQQVMLSARELSTESLPNRNWINEQLTFTHGYGLAVGPVNQVTPEGLPVLFVKDIPPSSAVPSLKVDRPEIYFGELSNDRVYVKTKAKEFDYPEGDENVFASYAGDGGVAIGSTWRQLLFATRFGDLKLLLSNDLTPESRVLFYRNIRDRLTHVAPFLRFDSDPYLVVSDGRLFWIADAYTVSNRYPYSQPMSGVNYIRNSVKAVVDAYHGDVRLYIADDRDPLIQTYARIFPDILRPLSEMPPDLRAHLRYPEDIFKIQTAVYSTYHMAQPQIFYNKEDQWVIASMAESQREGASQTMEPYYTIMKLPDGVSEEFILMLPFTPKQKDNMAAWMVARSDGEHYGRLVVYRFPKQKLVFGPKQVVARINQDADISRQLSLWNQRGSQVIFGPLMVIPIKEALIYVQPLYLRAETGKIPELRRVIVVAENRIAMEPTLEGALAQIFGAEASSTDPALAASAKVEQPPQTGETTASTQALRGARTLAQQAKQHYDRALQAQREGDWARYGEEIKRLGAVLEQMPKH